MRNVALTAAVCFTLSACGDPQKWQQISGSLGQWGQQVQAQDNYNAALQYEVYRRQYEHSEAILHSPCGFSYNTASDGSNCGNRSATIRPGGL